MTTRLATMLLVFVLAVAACLVALVWVNAPRASAQEEDSPANEPAFSVRCDFSHRNNDDPIVHPGKQGAAHSHDFFANTSTNYRSDYDSLRAAGTTCLNPADTSAYWIPTLSWNGKVLKSRAGIFYYRANRLDPELRKQVQAPPAGLKVVTAPNSHVRWQCVIDGGGAFTADPPTRCSSRVLLVRIQFPDCLASGQLDSANHTSHMAYSTRPAGSTYNRCPQTHPITVPMLVATIKYNLPSTRGEVTLSSGGPSTMHADFFNAWDQVVLEDLVATCIRGFDPSEPIKPEECRI